MGIPRYTVHAISQARHLNEKEILAFSAPAASRKKPRIKPDPATRQRRFAAVDDRFPLQVTRDSLQVWIHPGSR
jgi:hypothetical protein